jgi:transposase-like protein
MKEISRAKKLEVAQYYILGYPYNDIENRAGVSHGSVGSGIKGRYERVSVQEEREILALVTESGLPRRRALVQLGMPKSTYYRWLKRQTEGRLQNNKGGSPIP